MPNYLIEDVLLHRKDDQEIIQGVSFLTIISYVTFVLVLYCSIDYFELDAVKWLSPLLCIQEVPGSNFDLETGYPD
jgi:hypothetical protein